MEEYKKFWTNYTNFSGRSTRRDFWMVVLFNMVISGVLSYISASLGSVYSLITLIPGLAIAFRRLHDTNRSGGWIFISLVPLVGWIIYIVFMASASVDENIDIVSLSSSGTFVGSSPVISYNILITVGSS